MVQLLPQGVRILKVVAHNEWSWIIYITRLPLIERELIGAEIAAVSYHHSLLKKKIRLEPWALAFCELIKRA